MFLPCAIALAQTPAIHLHVDAREVTRGVIRVHETIPASTQAGGKISLYFPKWIPGEHSPSGPLPSLIKLRFTADGKELTWRRDPVEMFKFVVDLPRSATHLDADFVNVTERFDTFTNEFARIKWNRLILSPVKPSNAVLVETELTPPQGWQVACVLPTDRQGDSFHISSTNLTTVIDSPALIGHYRHRLELGAIEGSPMTLEVFTDSDVDLLPDNIKAAAKNIPAEFAALCGSRHFRRYNFLLTISDNGGWDGLEHHECSEDGLGVDQPKNDPVMSGYLLAHEFFHSWNGKFRRPRGLATPDYLAPMQGELLWVYEGLTQYYGFVVAARCGLITQEMLQDVIAGYWNLLANEPGRRWRSVADTAVSAQLTYRTPEAYMREIRRPDFYFEGLLIWLEADCLIRKGTNGQKSLDDFCRSFFSGSTGAPVVKPYDAAEVYAALNHVYPYDWKSFFQQRIYSLVPTLPLDGIRLAGYDVVRSDAPNWFKNEHVVAAFTYARTGFTVHDDGVVADIAVDGDAYKRGLALGDKIVKVNGKAFTPDEFKLALTSSAGTLGIEVEGGKKLDLPCLGGPLMPHLKRTGGQDLISAIAAPTGNHARS